MSDRLEEVKEKHTESYSEGGIYVGGYEDKTWLITEVERLSLQMIDFRDQASLKLGQLHGQIQSLTKALKSEQDAGINIRASLARTIEKLEAEILQQSKDWDELDDEYQKIKGENAELKEKYAIAEVANRSFAELNIELKKELTTSEKALLDAEEKVKKLEVDIQRHVADKLKL